MVESTRNCEILMAKDPQSIFVCQNCGRQARKWIGQCPDCGEWNTYEITLDGPHLELKVNGLVQNRAYDCEVSPGKIADLVLLDADDGLVEAGVERAELPPHRARDGVELAHVGAQREVEDDQERQGRGQQAAVDAGATTRSTPVPSRSHPSCRRAFGPTPGDAVTATVSVRRPSTYWRTAFD